MLGGGDARAVILGAAPQRVTVPGCGPLVINAGQGSYLRVRYSDAGLAALTERFAQLSVDDRLGLLENPLEVLRALEALGVELVHVLGA